MKGSFVLISTIQLEVLNWEKYNPRKDLVKHSWFRLENNLITSPEFFDFDHSEFCLWIYLLGLASQKQTGQISMSVSHAVTVAKIQKESIVSGLLKLQQLQCVQIITSIEHADAQITAPTNEHNNTLRDIRTNELKHSDAAVATVKNEKSLGSKIFETYSQAFQERYQVAPVRNAKTNSLCSQLAKRLGEDSHAVVRFYLAHNDGWYLKHQHDLGNLIKAAESLHTQWQRGQAVTGVQVRSFEKQSVNMDLLAKVRNGKA